MDKRVLKLFIATGMGTGYTPYIPGTAAALIGVAIHYTTWKLTKDVTAIMGALSLVALLLVSLTFILYDFALKEWNNHDAKEFVLDEIVGYLQCVIIVMIFNKDIDQVKLMFWGFILFRAFDILKIFPANVIDKNIAGAYGVLGDDLVSGMWAALLILLIF